MLKHNKFVVFLRYKSLITFVLALLIAGIPQTSIVNIDEDIESLAFLGISVIFFLLIDVMVKQSKSWNLWTPQNPLPLPEK